MQAQREAAAAVAGKLPSVTKDGHAIRLYANLAGQTICRCCRDGAEGGVCRASSSISAAAAIRFRRTSLFASYKQLVAPSACA